MHPYLQKLTQSNICFVDTESTDDGSMWSLQISTGPGTAAFILHDQHKLIDFIRDQLARDDMLTVAHNAPYDIPVIKTVDIIPSKYACTMQMAYLLQSEPQGLKPLAYRHTGMSMQSFTDVTAPYTRLKALKYLATAVELEWPDPLPVPEFKKDGSFHIRHPQNIAKKIAGILRDSTTVAIDKKLRRVAGEVDEVADPYKRWSEMALEDGREMVESKLGPLTQAYLSDIPFDDAVYYSSRDPDATARIYYSLWPQIQALGLEEAFWTDMAAMEICLDMMEAGILVDVPYLKSLSQFFDQKLQSISTEITALTGKIINPGSYQQVSDLLFKDLKVRTIKRFNKDGYHPTGDEILAQLITEHPVVQKIRDYKAIHKLLDTYTNQLPKWLDSNNRIHTTILMTRTGTGRLASKNPNLQNQPSRSEEGKKIRNAFIADEDCHLFALDYSQIELRLTAHESMDKNMLDVYNKTGGDIHAQTGSHIFGVRPEDLMDRQRKASKNVNFGMIYMISAQGLLEQFIKNGITGWKKDDCQYFINEWEKLYPGVIGYRQRTHSQARQYGYVTDMFGRIRYIPSVRCKSRWIVEEGLRQACNFPIQGAAAGIIKKAMTVLPPVYKYYQSQGYKVQSLLQVHDELDWNIADDIAHEVVPLIKSLMENTVKLRVPIIVDISSGLRWGEMTEWEESK